MRILIFGATGASGIKLIQEALVTLPDSTVVLYVRSPDKIPAELSANPSVTIIKGVLEDEEALSKALEGVDAVLSALGPLGAFHPSNTPLASAYGRIIDAMKKNNVKRLVALGTASITDPNDKSSWYFWLLVTAVKYAARGAYKDFVAIGEVIRASDLDYTIARVPTLTNKPTREVYAGYVGDGKTGGFLSRMAFAAFVIGEIQKNEWVKKAPHICSP